MTNIVTFVVPGEPRGKGRPRFSRRSGRTYTDDQTASYENLVRMMYRQAAGDTMLEGPLTLRVQAYLQTPKSASKKKLTQMICGFILPTKTPDLDNIVKAVLDGLNKVAFSDDAQIVNIYAIKRYAAVAPGLTVQIEQYDPLGPEAAL